ncbi:hypothetical protein HOY80DRAFT_1048180 [Tuber brumale]|nr:hypothetical protein HOY80DRAFT_1048180 [Tuber brumale]
MSPHYMGMGLSLPIDGRQDCEMSLKGSDMEKVVEDLKVWQIGGLVQPTLEVDTGDEESSPLLEDENTVVTYDARPWREELEEMEILE